MRVVFMGTPEFAVPSLRALAREHDVVAVYTRPDAASGRGRALLASPVKQAAEELGIRVVQPSTLRDAAVQQELAAFAPDVVVVAAYGLILPREVLDIPALGCVNVHGSLLPRWRGAAPVQRAILAGDATTGVSIMRMEEGLDTGPFCATVSVDVDAKTTSELTAEIARAGADLLVESLTEIAAGTCEWRVQDESGATYAEKIAKSDVALAPELTVIEAARRVRASSAQAPARLSVGGRGATVIEARAVSEPLAPGAVSLTKRALLIGMADGALELVRVKPDGKGDMQATDWGRGARFDEATTWSAS